MYTIFININYFNSELKSNKIQKLNKTAEATTHLGNVSEQLVKLKESYYERKLRLKEIEIENNQKYYSVSLALQIKLADSLNSIFMNLNK